MGARHDGELAHVGRCDTRDDVMNRFVGLSKSLNFPPGSKYSYSNTNYTIAAEIVKKVSGMSLSAFCKQYIFDPLGMTKTQIIDTHGTIVQDRAYGYRVPTPPLGWEIRMPNYDLIGPTNLQTTVDDLMRWDANFDTMTVGGATALTEMQTPGLGDYGLGLFIAQRGGIYVVEHDGRDAGYRSHLICFPDRSFRLRCSAMWPCRTCGHRQSRHGRWCVMLPSSILAQPCPRHRHRRSRAQRPGLRRQIRRIHRPIPQ